MLTETGGEEGIRTLDLFVANEALCWLSYIPMVDPMGIAPTT